MSAHRLGSNTNNRFAGKNSARITFGSTPSAAKRVDHDDRRGILKQRIQIPGEIAVPASHAISWAPRVADRIDDGQ